MRLLRLCIGYVYQWLLRPILFLFDAEAVHTAFTSIGSVVGTWRMTRCVLRYDHWVLKQDMNGLRVANLIGLAAGFDYDGYLAAGMANVGFGFNTVGTVTARAYAGNAQPRLVRLPKSKSLLVNKGFKSQGADAVAKRLDAMQMIDNVVGISVGSSNVPRIDTVQKAIDDYAYTFAVFARKPYVGYFELNISCPNLAMRESFTDIKNFTALVHRIQSLRIAQPIYVKMPNEILWRDAERLMDIGIHCGMQGFIFSNLVKSRENPALDADELRKVVSYKGNFSGKPTQANANELLRCAYAQYGNSIVLIGSGGVFSANDAYEMIKNGACAVQLITGLIYQGPQLVGQINQGLVEFLRRDGYRSIRDAVGTNVTKHI